MRTTNLTVGSRNFTLGTNVRDFVLSMGNRVVITAIAALVFFHFGDNSVIEFGDGSHIDAGYVMGNESTIGLTV